eukprot:scaffold882_cov384-Pavlova_lutheri.AAC.11
MEIQKAGGATFTLDSRAGHDATLYLRAGVVPVGGYKTRPFVVWKGSSPGQQGRCLDTMECLPVPRDNEGIANRKPGSTWKSTLSQEGAEGSPINM